jgi:hypothetical protein
MSEPDIQSLVRACCTGHPSERARAFEVFRQEWRRYLDAGLSVVLNDWGAAVGLCDEIYTEYQRVLGRPYDPAIRYEDYLICIAYAHLARRAGTPAFESLRAIAFPNPAGLADEERDVLLFCAILRTPAGCPSELLRCCFPQTQRRTLVRQVRNLFSSGDLCRQHLRRLLEFPPGS